MCGFGLEDESTMRQYGQEYNYELPSLELNINFFLGYVLLGLPRTDRIAFGSSLVTLMDFSILVLPFLTADFDFEPLPYKIKWHYYFLYQGPH
jgi:hypothetical protein